MTGFRIEEKVIKTETKRFAVLKYLLKSIMILICVMSSFFCGRMTVSPCYENNESYIISNNQKENILYKSTAIQNKDIIKPVTIYKRKEWLAKPPQGHMDKLESPVPYVIITHTATSSGTDKHSCLSLIQSIQRFHQQTRGFSDIAYNFLICGDGDVYEGRGWDTAGAHTKKYNSKSISITFIGTFNTVLPPLQHLEKAKQIIKLGVEIGKISENYKLYGHRQLMSTLSPGDTLFSEIKNWPHFTNNV